MITFESITLRGILSFGWEPVTLDLHDLNVFIGPNASGKSNLIEAFHLLRALPRDMHAPIRAGGGPQEWIHKGPRSGRQGEPHNTSDGASHGARSDDDNHNGQIARVEIVLAAPSSPVSSPALSPALRYRLALSSADLSMSLFSEELQTRDPYPQGGQPFLFFCVFDDQAAIKSFDGAGTEGDPLFGAHRWRNLDPWNRRQSVLAQLRDPLQYPQLTRTADIFDRIRIYQSFHLGPQAPARKPQPADLPNHALEPDASNLGLVLSRLRKNPQARAQLRENLRLAYAQADDIDIAVEGGTVQIFLHEEGLSTPTPATRLSDGTLRWLSLLALLLDPAPPPLLIIEEPELGLHPDLIPALGRLLTDTSTRTQLLVTTHSDTLVSAFTDSPEDVVVCERPGASTTFRRLAKEPLEDWLKDYSLGYVWRAGELGGNRW